MSQIQMLVKIGEGHEQEGKHFIGTFQQSHKCKSLGDLHCMSGAQMFTLEEWELHCARNRERTLKHSRERHNSGLRHPIHGHINKHLLWMKYLNRLPYMSPEYYALKDKMLGIKPSPYENCKFYNESDVRRGGRR